MVNRKQLNPEAGPVEAFGARLRTSREERGWTQEYLGEQMGYSSQHISAMETGRKPPTLRSSVNADKVFELADTRQSFERAYREIKNGSLLEGFPEYLALEGNAAEVRLFEVGVIPGLLQTREYAAELNNGAVERGDIKPEKAAERVEYLIERQAALVRTPSPLIIAVLDESCVRRPIGGPSVMNKQLDWLIEFADQSNTALHIAPYSMGARRPFNRSVNLLTQADRSIVSYVESQTSGHLDRELTSVLPLVKNYHQVQTDALSQAESVALIKQLRKGTP
ncbi:helix-turn-helix transcriptional regulator [Streptomyces sp. NPDC048057]|uniref:helix-turn-helix domain-containing protein n=1 Tax=Streptomyces sp. NPDC048057 TaxID=3155628 RepID=UPI0033E3EF91